MTWPRKSVRRHKHRTTRESWGTTQLHVGYTCLMTLRHDFSDSDYCDALLNLFKPGSGVRPPLLAGRTAEQTLLYSYLRTAQGKVDDQGCLESEIPHDIVLYGPRGNGKTVLLHQFLKQCRECKDANNKPIEIDTLDLFASKIKTLSGLYEVLFAPEDIASGTLNKAAESVRRSTGGAGMGITQAQVGVGASALTWGQMDEAVLRARLDGALLARCRARPLVVAIDEAHKLDLAVGNLLLNASQTVRKQGAPFLLVLAGTPNLRAHLREMDATFWGRSKKMAIGRLREAGTRDALVGPLQDKGIGFDPDALARVVADSQHYPYFIQLWGKALCEVLVKTKQGQQITASVADEAWTAVNAERRDYYQDRYDELQKLGLLDAAERVAGAFAGRDALHQAVVLRALTDVPSSDEAKALAQFEALSELGYLWRAPQQQEQGAPPPPDIEPGIPSLMTYVSEVLQAGLEALCETPEAQTADDREEERHDDGGKPNSP